MRLICDGIKSGSGEVFLCSEDVEDVWSIYGMVGEGDIVSAMTSRRVDLGDKKVLWISIVAEKMDYDLEGAVFHVSGKICNENEHVRRGRYHTLNIGVDQQVKIHKVDWDIVSQQRIREAALPSMKAALLFVVFRPGVANIVLLTGSVTISKGKIEMPIPSKSHSHGQQRQRAIREFYHGLYTFLSTKADPSLLRAIVLASPGHYSHELYSFICSESKRTKDSIIFKNLSKFIPIQSPTCFLDSIKDIVSKKEIRCHVERTKYTQEADALKEFLRVLKIARQNVSIGLEQIKEANNICAIKMLLVSTRHLRMSEMKRRRDYMSEVEHAKASGAEIVLFTSNHESSDTLDRLSGIAAILKYPTYA